MKRLFKNLMLVAVAAMAFVACSQDNDSINILAKKTVLHFNAGFADDTRSSFVEKEDGATSYKSVWNGGELLIISVCDSEGKEVGQSYANVKLDEGVESAESMHFSAEYNGAIPENGSITVYSGNWSSDDSGKYTPNIYSDQYGATDYSVASNFHICKSNTVEFTNDLPATIDLTFSTAVAFGKITMSQFSDVANKIDEVKVTINDNTTYTVYPENLTKPVVWFAAEAVEAVTKLSIEAKVDGVTYVKTAEKLDTSFETGLVRPINVSVMTEKPADYNVVLTKVTNIEGNTISFVGEDSNDKLTLAINPGLETIVAGTYTGVDATSYGPGFSSDSALEYDFMGSYFNISAAYNEDYDFYLNGSPIVITDLGDNNFSITTTTSTWIPVDNATKTVKITFEGKLEAELPTFTSATYTGGGTDKIIKLSGEELGELWINLYGSGNPLITSDNWINVGQYSINKGLYFGPDYGQYKPAGYSEWLSSTPNSFTLDVSIVDGQYMFVVNADYSNMKEGVTLVDATYHGDIENLDYPDLREPLATPQNVKTEVNGLEITITWDEVINAKDYTIEIDDEIVGTVSSLEYAFTGKYFRSYDINVYANPVDELNYRQSEANNVYVSIDTIEKTANGDEGFDFVYDSVESSDSNNYKFYQSSNTENYMLLSFANDITSLEAGSYTYELEDINYGENSAFNLPSYPNGTWKVHYLQNKVKVFIDVNDDKNYTITVFCYRDITGLSANRLFKGVYNGSLSSTVEPTALATPELTVTASGNTVTATWKAIDGAANYTVTLNGENKGTTTDTSISFSDLAYSTKYTVTVVANPTDPTANTVSEAASASVTTANAGGDEPEPAADSFEYLGRYYDIDSDASTSGGGYMYKVVAGGVEYSLELYWAYADATGAIKVGTYNYCYNKPDSMYSGWDGFSIISDSYYYGSTLEVTADGVVTLTLKDANGNLIGEYVYEGVAVF